MKNCLTAVLLFIALSFNITFAQIRINKVIEKDEHSYAPNTVVVKFKSPPAGALGKSVNLNSALAKKLEPFGITSAQKAFNTKHISSLNNVVVIQYAQDVDPYVVAAKLKETGEIEWAEPRFLRKIDYTPNDPSFTTQYALGKIQAFEAWDISRGDSSIIIAIIDTGVDWDHPDLAANIWVNPNEIPGNGIDDDGNGYIDDIRGWDFGGLNGTPDNNPMEDSPDHGTHVAGIAAAVSDNGIGVASIGFNSTIMAVKVTQNDLRNNQGQPYIVFGNEGIVYAVDNGARIINCSFGSSGYSILDQEVMDYATENNALIVAAAGNDNSSIPGYPASYRGVLSVASTDASDKRSFFSNYGTEVDVTAPGSSIYSTWQDNNYDHLSGTSMSSPLVAGLAALVAQRFPGYTPGQIAEQIRVNSDDIYSINPNHNRMLGKGRINAFKALSNTNSVAVRGVEFDFSDITGDGDGIFEQGETISLGIRFVNYLNPTTSLNISLESLSPDAVIQNGSFNAGSAGILESFDNYSARFTFTLSDTVHFDTKLLFAINFSDGSYTDFQMLSTTANQTYATQSGNNISLTINSDGSLGFNDYPENLNGTGFHYLDGQNLLFEGALILGTSSTKVADAARNSSGDAQDNDFSFTQPFILNIPGEKADQQGSAIFNDDNAGTSKIGVNVTLNSYTYSNNSDENYIILEYDIANTSGSEISNLYAGLFFDWDMVEGSGADDRTAFDDVGKLGYVYHPGGNPDTYVGTALISSESYGFWAIANAGDSGFQIYDGFSSLEKWQAISSGVGKAQAGPGDISHVISGGPFTIPANGSISTAFAVTAGPGLEALRNYIANARSRYNILT
ncbi:MAG: S8 family peptidase, partial [Ignavibacteriaceae bacterium]